MNNPYKISRTSRSLLGFCVSVTAAFLSLAAVAQVRTPQPASGGERHEKPVLPCSEVRARIRDFLDLHLVYKDFNEELSRRTFQKFMERLDPERLYFLEEDVRRFKPLENRLNTLVMRTNCGFIDEIHNVLNKRRKERVDSITQLLGKPLTASPEPIPVSFRKLAWAHDDDELEDRWQKKLRAQLFKMEADSEPRQRERLRKKIERQWKRDDEESHDELMSDFLNSFALSLDPHSAHFLPADQEDFNIKLGTPLEGVGITLTDEDDFVMVESLVRGGSAERDGRVHPGDRILSIDNLDGSGPIEVSGMEVSRVTRLVRGKKGTNVKITLERPATKDRLPETLSVVLPRESVRLGTAEVKSGILDVRGKRIGVIRVPTFYTDFDCKGRLLNDCRGASSDVKKELTRLSAEKVDGILLDIRNNSGGDLQESIRLAGLFLSEGTILQTVDRRRFVRLQQDPDPSVQYTGPLAVLVSKLSASASEIVAGALQDYGRALIVGDSRTYGKGSIQVVQDFPGTNGRTRDGMIKVTQAKFYGPKGKSNQNRGVESDIVIPALTEAETDCEKEKDFSLEADEIRAAPDFRLLQDFSRTIPKLRTLSEMRLQSNKDLLDTLNRVEKIRAEKEQGNFVIPDDPAQLEQRRKAREAEEAERREMRDESMAIHKSDAQLREAGNVLVDAMDMMREKSKWASGNTKNIP